MTRHVCTRTQDGAYQDGDPPDGIYVELDEQLLADMGYPETVTVTIEPGD
jgi:hypothetical protein